MPSLLFFLSFCIACAASGALVLFVLVRWGDDWERGHVGRYGPDGDA